MEGITQWLTVECGYQKEFLRVPAYQEEYLKAKSWLAGGKSRQPEMLDFIFHGRGASLTAIKK